MGGRWMMEVEKQVQGEGYAAPTSVVDSHLASGPVQRAEGASSGTRDGFQV